MQDAAAVVILDLVQRIDAAQQRSRSPVFKPPALMDGQGDMAYAVSGRFGNARDGKSLRCPSRSSVAYAWHAVS